MTNQALKLYQKNQKTENSGVRQPCPKIQQSGQNSTPCNATAAPPKPRTTPRSTKETQNPRPIPPRPYGIINNGNHESAKFEARSPRSTRSNSEERPFPTNLESLIRQEPPRAQVRETRDPSTRLITPRSNNRNRARRERTSIRTCSSWRREPQEARLGGCGRSRGGGGFAMRQRRCGGTGSASGVGAPSPQGSRVGFIEKGKCGRDLI